MTGTMATSKETLRFGSLEGSRAFLAWWVVASHLLLRSGFKRSDLPPFLDILRDGGLAVEVFMILSGFVIAHLVFTSRESYGVYIWRRFMRLYPVFFLAIVATLVMAMVWGGKVFPRALNREHLEMYLGTHLLMMHGAVPNELLPDSASAFLPPAWSISLEWQFYMVAPPIIIAVGGLARRWWFAAALIVAISLLIMVFGDWKGIPAFGQVWTFSHSAFLPLKLANFVLGIGCYFLLRQVPAVSLPVAACAVVVAWLLTGSTPISVWCAIFLSLRCEALRRFFAFGPFVKLGNASYSTYLLHVVIIAPIERLWLLPMFPGRGWVFVAILTAVSVPLIAVASLISYSRLERPIIEWARRVSKSWGSPALARSGQ